MTAQSRTAAPLPDTPPDEARDALELPLRELVSPLPLLAVALLAVNDHVWKTRYGGWWTGKLSDFAGLIYFPLLLTAGANTLLTLAHRSVSRLRGGGPPWPRYPLRHWQLVGATLLTGLVFSAINLSPVAMTAWIDALDLFHRVGLIAPSGGVCDAEDLIALPALLVSYAWGRRYLEPSRRS